MRFVCVLAAVLSAGWTVPPQGPANAHVSHAVIKAVYLYNFARFTEWPASMPKGPLTLCVMDDPDVAASLDGLAGDKPINGRDVTVASIATFRIVRQCHLLYVPGSDRVKVLSALDSVSSLPVLTVGDGEVFTRAGGVAALLTDGERTRFAINPDALTRSGLRISSQVLGLARLIREDAR